VLGESDLSHQAAADSLPLQDAFAVLFFVSVGMLFDPTILVREPLAVLVVLLVIVLGKSLAAFLIVLAFGYPVGTALTVSASLAQIGEFSFILAGLGLALGLLPKEGQDLILAGALLSIALNPLVFKVVDPGATWFRNRPGLRAWIERPGRDQPVALPDQGGDTLQGHTMLIGFGRAGAAIGDALEAFALPFIVVERDLRRVEELRARGLRVIYGDASAPGILTAAGIERARLLIVATPDSYQARRAFAIARQLNPEVETVVRVHGEADLAYFKSRGAGLAVLVERELALTMLGYALRRLGLSEGQAQLYVQSYRSVDSTGAVQGVSPHYYGVPELRHHREPEGAGTPVGEGS
jgi:CPA2 family monovalent cation:H+ antiporter-2